MSRDDVQHEMGEQEGQKWNEAKGTTWGGNGTGYTLGTPRLEGRPFPRQILCPPLSTGKPTSDNLEAYFQEENNTQAVS